MRITENSAERLVLNEQTVLRSRRTIDAITLLRSQKNMDLAAARQRVAELQRELGSQEGKS